jgi:hypothetical protein
LYQTTQKVEHQQIASNRRQCRQHADHTLAEMNFLFISRQFVAGLTYQKLPV